MWVYTSTQRVSTTPSRRAHWSPGRPSWEYQLTNGKGRIRRSLPHSDCRPVPPGPELSVRTVSPCLDIGCGR